MIENNCNHFATLYLYESGLVRRSFGGFLFSSLVAAKFKSQNHLSVKNDIRVILSKTKHQFDVVIDDRQEHPLHVNNIGVKN